MSDLLINEYKYQGKKARAVYIYQATMNDELTFKTDDIIVITQSSEDETWLEGTLNGRTGWFPSNYVELLEDKNHQTPEKFESKMHFKNMESQSDDTFRIKIINEFKRTEEDFLDDMCKFIKIALIPLQANKNIEIFQGKFLNQLNSSIDELLRCHQAFFQQLKEINENSDAKLGSLLITMASRFKLVYESYANNNPKFTNSINKKKEQLAKFFDSSLNKMSMSTMNSSNMNNSAIVTLYLTKYLAAPFKQLETYSKLLKELYRFTEDYHADRGDVQRSMEFYTELASSVQEIRHKKECELDIMSSRINNIDDDIFQNGESLFLSSVLTINENGERKDHILLLFTNHLILLSHSPNKPNEFDFDSQIPFFKITHTGNSLIQTKKLTSIELMNLGYGSNLIDPISIKYCFELICTNGSRLLIVCSTNYDLKMIVDIISNQLSKIQFSLNNKSLKSPKESSQASSPAINLITSSSFKGSSLVSPVHSKHNGSVKAMASNLSGSTLNNSLNTSSRTKTFSMRPHPPLIPHFQLPTDNLLGTGLPVINNNTGVYVGQDSNPTLKRFMYKKAKLSEPFGKYHGADDDLKLLNVIESFCKTKVRQSVNINIQDTIISTSTLNKSQQSTELETSDKPDLNEIRKSNKDLKMMVSSLQKQLEQEKLSRRKLENFIRKELKTSNQMTNADIEIKKIVGNMDHESTI